VTRYTLSVRTLFSFIALFFLALAPVSHAEQTDVWDFRTDQHLPASVVGLTMAEKQPEGIHVQTSQNGFLIWNTPFVHPVDVLTLRLRSKKPVTIGLLWHPTENLDEQVQRDIDIPASETTHIMSLSLHDWKSWNWKTAKIGIGLPMGTDIVLEEMIWRQYSFTEKMANAWASFWTFDEFRAYSINFLWGPLLGFDPVALEELYDHLPPTAWSVTRIFYALLGICALIGVVFSLFDRKNGRHILLWSVFGTLGICWLLFDMRMGAELMSYAVTDYKTFVQPPDEDKMFRTHGNFYTLAERMMPLIARYDRYVVYTREQMPFYSNLRYLTYPSIALRPDQDTSGVKLWVMIDRGDIRVENNRLVDGNGTILSGTGTVIANYDTGSFLFATQ